MNRASLHSRAVDALLLLIASIAVTLLWFNNGNLVLGGDVASIPFDPARTATRYLSSWNFWNNAGNPIPAIISNEIPPLDFLFYYSLHLASVPISVAEGVYIVLFSYFLPAISTYSLVSVLFESRIRFSRLAGFTGGVFAILNPIYVYSSAPSSILNSAIPRASLPLALFILIAGFKKRDLRYAIGLGLSTVLMFSVFARATELGFFLLIASILAVPHLIKVLKRKDITVFRFTTLFLTIAFITFVMVNLFWIGSFLSDYSLFYQTLSTFPTSVASFESQFTTLQNILRLQGYWPFYVGEYVPYASFFSSPSVEAITYSVPAIAIVGLFSIRRARAETLSLSLLLAIVIAMALGTNLPLNIFQVLIQLPLLKFFKDPWVFLEALSLIYSVLFGVGISFLAVTIKRVTRDQSAPKVIAFAIALLVLSTVSWPAISGSVFVNWYQPSTKGVNVPPAYQELNDWLARDTCVCATMLVPELKGTYVATTWGYQGSNSLYQNLISSKLITGSEANYGLQPQPEQELLNYVYTLMSRGDPTYSPTSLNTTSDLQDWHFPTESQATTDSLTIFKAHDPWDQTSIEWRFGPLSEGAQNGHSIYFQSDSKTDLSQQHWILLWASSEVSLAKLWFGVGYGGGEVGWYGFGDHTLFTLGSWTLFGFPVTQPDAGSFPPTHVTNFFINYGRYLGAEAASLGRGTVDFGPVFMSTGHVSEDFIQVLLEELNVKYVVIDNSIQSSLYPQLDVAPYKLAIAQWTGIMHVKTLGDLAVYENSRFGSSVSIPSKWIQVPNLYLLPNRFTQAPSQLGLSAFVVGNDASSADNTSNATIESVTQRSPTEFDVRAHTSGSFLLVLSTSFDDRWHATALGGVVGNHLVTDGYANGWVVSGIGEMSIHIDYAPQVGYQNALLISIGSVLTALAVLVWIDVEIYRKRHRPIIASNPDPSLQQALMQ